MEMYTPNICNPTHIDNQYVVDLSDEEYAICDVSAHSRWSNKKTGRYGKGLANGNADPHRVERFGLLGEMAYAKVFGESVDVGYTYGGDKYDFLLGRFKVDIKNSMANRRVGLIYYRNDWGKVVPLSKDIYVFAYTCENRQSRTARVFLIGYCGLTDVESKGNIAKGIARGSKHFNYEVAYSCLYPIGDLLECKLAIDG